LGIIQVANALPASWNIGTGDFANILGGNIYGSILCFGLYILGLPFTESRLMRAYSFITRYGNGYKFSSSEQLQDIAVESKDNYLEQIKPKEKDKSESESERSEVSTSEIELENKEQKVTSNQNKPQEKPKEKDKLKEAESESQSSKRSSQSSYSE